MATFTLQSLKDEIDNDPLAIGYKIGPDDWESGIVIVGLINDPVNGAQITRMQVTPQEIASSITLSEYVVLTLPQRQYLDLLIQAAGSEGAIDAGEPEVLNALTTIFVAGSDTRTALLAKIQRQGSRAEVLWGDGRSISESDVGKADNI